MCIYIYIYIYIYSSMCVSDSLDPSKANKQPQQYWFEPDSHIGVKHLCNEQNLPKMQQGSSHDKKTTHGNYTILKFQKKNVKKKKQQLCVSKSLTVSAHLGRHCPSHLKFLLQLCHTCRSRLVFRWLPEFVCETCLGQQPPLRMILMALFENGPVKKNRSKVSI